MRKPLEVRVRRLADESEQDLPIKSWSYIKDNIDDVTKQKKFELIGYYDEHRNLIEGDPNHQPQQATTPVNGVDHAGKAGEVVKRRGRRPSEVKLQETQA